MPSCLTCRHRKVKCDGRPITCLRCEKLGIQCRQQGSPREVAQDMGASSLKVNTIQLTQAGYKRFRTSIACETCRKRKLKCDASRPSCSTCVRRDIQCHYITARETRLQQRTPMSDRASRPEEITGYANPRDEPRFSHTAGNAAQGEPVIEQNSGAGSVVNGTASPEGREAEIRAANHDQEDGREVGQRSEKDASAKSRTPLRFPSLPLPSGSDLLPYIDSFLENIHPISCNNFLHPGVVCEALGKAPRLLVLAVCGASAKFLSNPGSKSKGYQWIAEARNLIFNSMHYLSTLTVTAIQFVAMHDMHEANFTSAWNLIGIATRMAIQLRLNNTSSRKSFLQQECNRRLMWSVYVSDLLFAFDESYVPEECVADVQLPCNLWNFTQGMACKTLRLHEIDGRSNNISVRQATNPCAYLIKILVIRRKILRYIHQSEDLNAAVPWVDGSYFQELCGEMEIWRRSLPSNFAFGERQMYTFRVSRHLDMFLMMHAWYHQCGIDLFGAWMPRHTEASPIEIYSQQPPEFQQRCLERCTFHAKSITSLIVKVLKVESDHLFRDAWFSICVLDSTQIQVMAMERQNVTGELLANVVQLLKVNLRALTNTKKTLVLAEKSYQMCCSIIRKAGMGRLVLEDPDNLRSSSMDSESYHSSSTIPLFRRYPFLEPDVIPDTETWEQLLNASTLVAATRDSSPVPDGEEEINPEIRRQHLVEIAEVHINPSMANMSYTSDIPLQQHLFYPWHSHEEMDWQQLDIDHTAAAALIGMNTAGPISSVSTMEGEQDLIGLFDGSFAAAAAAAGNHHGFNNSGYGRT